MTGSRSRRCSLTRRCRLSSLPPCCAARALLLLCATSRSLNPEETFQDRLEKLQPRLVVVCEDGFNFLSKMCLTRNREVSFWMARTARERGIPIAAHSPDASDHVAGYLQAGFDYVLMGEVESTLVELAGRGIRLRRSPALCIRTARWKHRTTTRRES